MNKIVVFVFSVLLSLDISAQQGCNSGPLAPITGEHFLPYYFQYEGNPFLNSDWTLGNLRLINGDVYTNLKLNYDSYKGNLLYLNSALERVVIVDNDIISDFWMRNVKNNSVLHGVPASYLGITKTNGFVFLMIDDTVSLYMRIDKKISPNSFSYREDNKLGIYYEERRYFFILNSIHYEVPKRRKKLAENFAGHEEEILRYIRSRHFSLRDEANLRQVFTEINLLEK
ncbi:MAG: hypothetical protein JXB49_20975 [Bacteroidales bacterium]|nr:hypothetical protein [Bacteroidales bacterium]